MFQVISRRLTSQLKKELSMDQDFTFLMYASCNLKRLEMKIIIQRGN